MRGEGVEASPDTWQDNMREVLLENTANRTIATEKDPRLNYSFPFVFQRHPRSDDSHSGKKCHRHLAQQTSPQTLLAPASGSGCPPGSLAQEGPLGQLLLLTCAYPRVAISLESRLRLSLHSRLSLKSLLSGDFQPHADVPVPRVGSGMAWPLVGQQGERLILPAPTGPGPPIPVRVGGSGRACPGGGRLCLKGQFSAFSESAAGHLGRRPLGFHTAILEAPGPKASGRL